jgi:hypothetical protein
VIVAGAVVAVGLFNLSGRTSGEAPSAAAGPPATTTPDGVRIVAKERTADRLALTVTARGALRETSPSTGAFDVTVNGRHTAATVERAAPQPLTLAVVLAPGGDLTRTAAYRQNVANGLVELLPQLPARSAITVIDSSGPSADLRPVTADVANIVNALSGGGSAAPAPDVGLRLASRRLTTAPAGQRAVVRVGSDMTALDEHALADAALDARMAGIAVYVVGGGASALDQLRAALEYTGGTAYVTTAATPLAAYDELAADLTDRYRLAIPAPAPAAVIAVQLTGTTGGYDTATAPK